MNAIQKYIEESKKMKFEEKIMSVEDQKKLSSELFGDANFSDNEILEDVDQVVGLYSDSVCAQCESCFFSANGCALEVEKDELLSGKCEDWESLQKHKDRKPASFFDLNRDYTDAEFDLYF